MPKYSLQDSLSGRTMLVEADSPPTEQEASKLFESIKQPQQQVNNEPTLGLRTLEVLGGIGDLLAGGDSSSIPKVDFSENTLAQNLRIPLAGIEAFSAPIVRQPLNLAAQVLNRIRPGYVTENVQPGQPMIPGFAEDVKDITGTVGQFLGDVLRTYGVNIDPQFTKGAGEAPAELANITPGMALTLPAFGPGVKTGGAVTDAIMGTAQKAFTSGMGAEMAHGAGEQLNRLATEDLTPQEQGQTAMGILQGGAMGLGAAHQFGKQVYGYPQLTGVSRDVNGRPIPQGEGPAPITLAEVAQPEIAAMSEAIKQAVEEQTGVKIPLKTVRPFEETQIVGEQPEVINLGRPIKYEQPIEPAYQAAGEPKQGGQISFEGEAAAVPTARQQAVEPVSKPIATVGDLLGLKLDELVSRLNERIPNAKEKEKEVLGEPAPAKVGAGLQELVSEAEQLKTKPVDVTQLEGDLPQQLEARKPQVRLTVEQTQKLDALKDLLEPKGRGIQIKLKQAGESGAINLDILADVVDYGRHLAGVIKDKTAWASEMVNRLGEQVRPYIEQAWEKVQTKAAELKDFDFTLPNQASQLMANPARMGLVANEGKDVDLGQIARKLIKSVSETEQQRLKEKGLLEKFPIGATGKVQELRDFVGGEEVGVKVYGMEGKVSEAKKEFDKMTHEWFDTLKRPQKDAVQDALYQLRIYPELKSSSFHDTLKRGFKLDIEKFDSYAKNYREGVLEFQVEGTPRATSYYSSVSALPTDQPMPEWTTSKMGKNVQRVDVVIPTSKENVEYEGLLKRRRKNPYSLSETEEARYQELENRSLHDEPMWRQDDLHEQLPNTLGWAMIQYKTGPKGEKIAVVAEAQSRWGQEVRNRNMEYAQQAKNMKAVYKDSNWTVEEPGTTDHGIFASKEEAEKYITQRGQLKSNYDHPLLRDYNRLILKAAIEQARKEGATHIFVSDAESAMMTEMHDSQAAQKPSRVYRVLGENQAEALQNFQQKYPNLKVDSVNYNERNMWDVLAREQIDQEPGMRLNYDKVLPKIAEELTGSKGERVSLGEHKNAFEEKTALGGGLAVRRPWDKPETLVRQQRANLIFHNPDGTPKTDISGMMYKLPEVTTPATTGKGRPLDVEGLIQKLEAARGKGPAGGISGALPFPEAYRHIKDTAIDFAVSALKTGLKVEEVVRRVSTKFNKEIGQWVSLALSDYLKDDKGADITLYHGTKGSDFSKLGEGSGQRIDLQKGHRGFTSLATDVEEANFYTGSREASWRGAGEVPEGARIYPVKLKAGKLWDYRKDVDSIPEVELEAAVKRLDKNRKFTGGQVPDVENIKDDLRMGVYDAIEALVPWLKKNGFDTFTTKAETSGGLGVNYNVFDPKRIENKLTAKKDIQPNRIERVAFRDNEGNVYYGKPGEVHFMAFARLASELPPEKLAKLEEATKGKEAYENNVGFDRGDGQFIRQIDVPGSPDAVDLFAKKPDLIAKLESFKTKGEGMVGALPFPEAFRHVKNTVIDLMVAGLKGGTKIASIVKQVRDTYGAEVGEWAKQTLANPENLKKLEAPGAFKKELKAIESTEGTGQMLWGESTLVGVSKERTAEQRVYANLPEQDPVRSKAGDEVYRDAKQKLKDNKNFADNIIAEVEREARPLSDVDVMALHIRQQEQLARYDRADKALSELPRNAKTETRVEMEKELAQASIELDRTLTALETGGTATARGLAMRRIMSDQLMEYGHMVRRVGNAKGRKLSPKEDAALLQQLKDLDARYRAAMERNEKAESVIQLGKWEGLTANMKIDKLISKLEKAKFKREGQVDFLGFDAMRKQVWNSALDVAITALKAGKASHIALQKAVQYMREQGLVHDDMMKAKNHLTRKIMEEEGIGRDVAATRAELSRLRNEFMLLTERERFQAMSGFEKAGHVWNKGAGLIANLLSSYDVSAPRQMSKALMSTASPLRLVTNPKGGVKATARPIVAMFKALKGEEEVGIMEQERLARKNHINGNDRYVEYTKIDATHYTPHEENASSIFDAIAASKIRTGNAAATITTAPIKLVAKGVRASNRSFNAGLNTMRAELFDLLLKENFPDGNVTNAQLKLIANWVNVATGRGKVGKKAEVFTKPFWAPKLFMSQVQFLSGEPLWSSPKISAKLRSDLQVAQAALKKASDADRPEIQAEVVKAQQAVKRAWAEDRQARALVAKEYAKVLTSAAALYFVSQMFSDKKETSPLSSDFGKVVRGKTRYDFFGGVLQPITFGSRVTTGETKTLMGETRDLLGKDAVFSDMLDAIVTFGRSKLHPLYGEMLTSFSGEEYTGKKVERIEPSRWAKNLMLPLPIKELDAIFKDRGVVEGSVTTALQELGVGVNVYEDEGGKKRRNPPSAKAPTRPKP